jgi:hypothetical protein
MNSNENDRPPLASRSLITGVSGRGNGMEPA